ncbi:hypothetical protein [Candidatus Lokiarchaeum ossiferum]|uniref:hypothetical protein n=1 Tax=Candidatus Lokiarchaeum ossiferum TaxID=2951803 RepID=UPI00352D619D
MVQKCKFCGRELEYPHEKEFHLCDLCKDDEIDYKKCWKNLRKWLGSGFLSTCAYQVDRKMTEIEKEALDL